MLTYDEALNLNYYKRDLNYDKLLTLDYENEIRKKYFQNENVILSEEEFFKNNEYLQKHKNEVSFYEIYNGTLYYFEQSLKNWIEEMSE